MSYPGWREAGACLTADPNLFFPVENGYAAVRQMMKAQQICAQCGVRRECLDFAMETGQTHGIWGGTTPEQRARARRKRTAARRRQARVSLQDADAPEPARLEQHG